MTYLSSSSLLPISRRTANASFHLNLPFCLLSRSITPSRFVLIEFSLFQDIVILLFSNQSAPIRLADWLPCWLMQLSLLFSINSFVSCLYYQLDNKTYSHNTCVSTELIVAPIHFFLTQMMTSRTRVKTWDVSHNLPSQLFFLSNFICFCRVLMHPYLMLPLIGIFN